MERLLSHMIIKKIYGASSLYTEEGTCAKRNDRPCFAIVIKYEGETVYRCKGESIVSNLNNIVILPKGSSYSWECTKSGHFLSLEFQCDAAVDRILSFPVSNGEEILDILKGIERKRLIKKPLYETECLRDAYSVLLKLGETQVKKYVPGEKAKKLLPVIEYISKNLSNEIKNDDLAKMIGVSTVYFRKLFAQVYGMSPMNYVKNLRIKKAKEMLRSDHGSITDIAFSLGYSNIYDFSRDFKKRTGTPPSKY